MKGTEIGLLFEEVAPIKSGSQAGRNARHLGFRFGNPEVEVTGVGVAWYLANEVIEQAIEKRLNFLLIHEPRLFYVCSGEACPICQRGGDRVPDTPLLKRARPM
jgi:putative NIF3 family GTP cyclohydrolase 1 type 2